MAEKTVKELTAVYVRTALSVWPDNGPTTAAVCDLPWRSLCKAAGLESTRVSDKCYLASSAADIILAAAREKGATTGQPWKECAFDALGEEGKP